MACQLNYQSPKKCWFNIICSGTWPLIIYQPRRELCVGLFLTTRWLIKYKYEWLFWWNDSTQKRNKLTLLHPTAGSVCVCTLLNLSKFYSTCEVNRQLFSWSCKSFLEGDYWRFQRRRRSRRRGGCTVSWLHLTVHELCAAVRSLVAAARSESPTLLKNTPYPRSFQKYVFQIDLRKKK